MKKAIYIALCSIIAFLIMVSIFSQNDKSFLGFRIYRVGSGSMEPYLRVNGLILIKKSKSYEVNDVATYEEDGMYVTHRIVSINGDEVILKGDANNTNDTPINKNAIVGKLVYRFRIFDFVSQLLSKPFIWILIFIFGLIIVYFKPKE